MLISMLAERKARCTDAFSLFSAKPQSSCFRRACPLQIFSNFCIIMFIQPFFLRLCMRSEAPFVPPLNTQRFRVLLHYRDWWQWAALKWWREKNFPPFHRHLKNPTNIDISRRAYSEKCHIQEKSPNSDNPSRICCLRDPYQIRSTLIIGIIVVTVSVNLLIEWISQNEAGLKRSGSSLPRINAVKMLNNRS